MSVKKIPLLYVGPGYNLFTQTQCNQLVSQSGATEFLLTTAFSFNYCQPNDYILTQAYVDQYVDDSYFGTTNEDDIETIRGQMSAAISAANAYDSNVWNYTAYVDSAVTVAQRLINADSSCKIWIGLPPMLVNCTTAAMRYNYYYHDYIVNLFKTRMTNIGKWNNVEGYYYGQEDLPQWYTKFNINATNNYFDNVVVQNIEYMSGVVKGLGKKFLWIPYYRDDGSELPTRLGYIINKRDFFDYAILQPSYYFDSNVGASNVTLIKNCISQQKCLSASGAVIGSTKTSTTEIGGEMEIDGNAKTDFGYLSRYNTYVSNFSTFITGSNKRPIAFYADYPEVLMDSVIFGKVASFFTSGT